MKTNVKKGIITGLAGLLVGCSQPEQKAERYEMYPGWVRYNSIGRCKDGREVIRYPADYSVVENCEISEIRQDPDIIIDHKTGELIYR